MGNYSSIEAPTLIQPYDLQFIQSGRYYNVDLNRVVSFRQKYTHEHLTSSDKTRLTNYVIIFNTLKGTDLNVYEKRIRSFLENRSIQPGWFNLDSGRWKSKPDTYEKRSANFRLISSSDKIILCITLLLELRGVKIIPIPSASTKISWPALRRQVWERQAMKKCFCCLKPITVDNFDACHLTPRSHGGKDHPDNLRAGCSDCNKGKGGMHDIHAYEYMFLNNKPGLQLIPTNDPMLRSIIALCKLAQTYVELDIPEELRNDLSPNKAPAVRLEAIRKITNLTLLIE